MGVEVQERRLRIMIVENDVASATQIAGMLLKCGHEVIMAEELYCLDEIKSRGQVDMVITDIFLNNASGLQIVLDVKGYDPGIKVVAMSGGGPSISTDYLDYAMEFGADAVVRKPLNEANMADLLKKLSDTAACAPKVMTLLPVSRS